MGRWPLLVSITLFMGLCAAFLCPEIMMMSEAAALNDDHVETSLTLEMDDEVNLTVMPGIFSTASQTILVSTSNPAGYTLTIETTGISSALVNDFNGHDTIPTFSEDEVKASEAFPYGYGYSMDGESFFGVPEPADEKKILVVQNSAGQKAHELTFGILTGLSTPAGTYSNTFRITAVANLIIERPALERENDTLTIAPAAVTDDTGGELKIATTITQEDISADDVKIMIEDIPCSALAANYDEKGHLKIICSYPALTHTGENEVTLEVQGYSGMLRGTVIVEERWTLAEISTMQEMTAAVCANTEIGVSQTLLDSRDDATYSVAKLNDGNCWMTRNLMLGSAEEMILTPEDSDVDNDFILPIAQTEGKQGWNNAIARVYDPGDEKSGKLYNWFTATAGTGVDGILTDNSQNSICPKGWALPTIRQYEEMLAAYGWTNKAQVVDILTTEPFNFTFSGGYYYGYGGTDHGEYWTSTPMPDNAEKSYYLKIESSSRRVYTDTNKPRSTGSAVRCVARTNENATF